ncbi:hypothetical protein [Streptomyces sioyaensis]|uniref:hypothetical protein n=1 Tax=Streptomyces sioyaensis TaxID=67364 RepID=UPI003712A024
MSDSELSLPEDLADALRSWSLSRPPGGFASRPDLRKHVKQGLAVARRLARHLGPHEWQRLFREGRELAKRVAHELGPARRVTYKGLAHGGLAFLTSVTWQGDREL